VPQELVVKERILLGGVEDLGNLEEKAWNKHVIN
jgi:hypothetical protein